MLPNFIIVGAAKSGTTSLYHYCLEHPDIFMSNLKEPHYFSGNPGGFDINEYESLFDKVKNEIMIGEASTSYLRHEKAPILIKDAIPNCKIIIMLRNPVDRLFSAYLLWKRLGHYIGSIEKLILKYNSLNGETNHKKQFNIISNGIYYEKVKKYIDLFGKQNVYIGLFEDMKLNPDVFFPSLFSFLGVSTALKSNFNRKYNVGYDPMFPYYQKIVRTISNVFRKSLLRVFDYQKLRKIRTKVLLLNTKKSKPNENKMSAKVRKLAYNIYREDIMKLQSLIDRDLSRWIEF